MARNCNPTTVYESAEETILVDTQTGEVISETSTHTQKVRLPKEPDFVKLYLDHLGAFKGVQPSMNPILAEFLKRTTYANPDDTNGGMLLLVNKVVKDFIAQKCGISTSRVNEALGDFVRKGYMQRIGTGAYQLNPLIFGKGEWKDISAIRATYDYATGEARAEIIKSENTEDGTELLEPEQAKDDTEPLALAG